ncbi:MAG TPA: hypothetical protein VJI52_03390 [Candidatus Nanoarchaeia archaeon]|nr:hypothetical protein [Candidatus Nanoarchaeia archaeon]
MQKRGGLSSEVLVYWLLIAIVGIVAVIGINYISSQKSADKNGAAGTALNKGATTVLKSSDGSVLIIVPAGAATSTKEISIKSVENPMIDSKNRASEIYQFGPAGTTFSSPVEIRIKYDPKIVGDCPSLINFYHYNEDGTLKEYAASKNIYCSSHIAAFDIDSFSFGYAARADLRDEENLS